MKQQADKKRKDVEFQVDDWVYLKIQPYRLKSLARKVNEKSSPGFYRPYKEWSKLHIACFYQTIAGPIWFFMSAF